MTDSQPIRKRAILFDATRCIDCRACMVACSVENKISDTDTRVWVSGAGVLGKYPDLNRATMPYHCMHCQEPACVSACPVGAWTKREDGPVVYASEKCIGCRYCMNACPFDVPHFDWNKGIAEGPLIDKCDMCAKRVDGGGEPACVATCPTSALVFGDRDELLTEAHRRLQTHPDKYQPRVFGEHENGGTSYLILSHVPFDQLNLPHLSDTPVVEMSETIMGGTIPFALTWAAVLGGVAAGTRLLEKRRAPPAEVAVEVERQEEK
jgi:formate dehydrogenase iron-sulfur subunit